MSSGRLAA